MDGRPIVVSFLAPVEWQKSPRHRMKWVLARCTATAHLPELSAEASPVAVAARANPAIERYPEPKRAVMTWRRGPEGLVRDMAEVQAMPQAVIPGAENDRERDMRTNRMVRLTAERAEFACPAARGHVTTDPMVVDERELEGGIVGRDLRAEARDAVLRTVGACALVDGVVHLKAEEPFLRVNETNEITVCESPERSPRDAWDGGAYDPSDAGSINVFRIDRMEAARDFVARHGYDRDIVADRVKVDPGYEFRGSELATSLRYVHRTLVASRLITMERTEADRRMEEAVSVLEDYERTGEGLEAALAAVARYQEVSRDVGDVAMRLEATSAPAFAP